MKILILNAGSSSLKISLFESEGGSRPIWETHADIASGRLDLDGVLGEHKSADAVGHRVVHGGGLFHESTKITPDVRAAISRLGELAPAHNRLELEGIEAVDRLFGPAIPQVAVFDTSFHTTLQPAAYVYPGPYEWLEQGIRRYGFHGISHQYTSRRAAEILGRDLKTLRLVTCHLGNGCSLAAIRDGASVDTTMGYTPLDGLMMGSRSGAVDPGILIHLLTHGGYDAERLDRVLNQESGLKGISGLSEDMRTIEAAMAEGNERARLAFDIYVHRLRAGIGALAASAGGLDALVFMGGVGENSAPVRAAVCNGLGFLGVKLDAGKNAGSPADEDIATADSTARVLLVHTRENWEIALECMRVLSNGPVSASAAIGQAGGEP